VFRGVHPARPKTPKALQVYPKPGEVGRTGAKAQPRDCWALPAWRRKLVSSSACLDKGGHSREE
jgi:hypothetical protein